MKAVRRIFFSLILLFIIPMPNYALETDTHQTINKYIALGTINGFSLDSYLKNQLQFQHGVNEEFTFGTSKYVWTWIGYGGETEDKPPGFFQIPYLRSTNHFHDPISNQGFSGLIFGFIPPLFLTGESSIQWSQKAIGSQSTGGYYSWFDIRDYYYKALTSPTKTDRDKYFAGTFRGLGQLMHLVQDLSVPAHARNQFHAGYDYEGWVNKSRSGLLSLPSISFDQSLLNLQSPLAPVPLANIFDSEKYTGSNPEITVTGGSIGLSEYANANFFSDGTIFKDYPHPRKENTTAIVIESVAEDGEIDKPYYVSGYQSETLALYSYFANIAPDLPGEWKYTLDDTVYKDYAQKLIPRAVGYSAGLLDYFFRGQLEVTAVPIFYKNSITYLMAKVKNMTPNETMKDGTFILTYSYRPANGNPDGSEDIWAQAPPVSSGTLQYGGDAQNPVQDTVVSFMLPTPIPRENYNSAKFTLAFKGTLGNEVGAVIGKALILGEIKFEEEWDNGLNGNHNWAHTGFNLLNENPDNGTTSNIIESGALIKDNVRRAGSWSARVNESFMSTRYNNGQYKGILPIQITRDTYIQFKIDEMWINQKPPASPGYTTDWQVLSLHFNNGLGMQFYTQGQGVYLGSNVAYFEFDPNLIFVENMYDFFRKAGITVPPGDLYLEEICFLQQLWIQEIGVSDVDNHQHMKVDSIRIVEGKKQ
jgi:hypothetical protein